MATTPVALFESEIDALVIATADHRARMLLSLAAAAGLPAFCEKPVALDLDARRRHRAKSPAQGSSSRSASSAGSTPATAPLATPSPQARSATSSCCARRLTIPTRRRRPTSRPPAASSATCTFTTSTRSASSPARRSSRCTPPARFARQRGSQRYGDVDVAAAVLAPRRRRARHHHRNAARPARLRRAARGLRHGRQPRHRPRRSQSLRSVDRAYAPPAPGHADFLERFEPAYRAELGHVRGHRARTGGPAPARSTRHAPRLPLRSPLTAREPSERPVRVSEIHSARRRFGERIGT